MEKSYIIGTQKGNLVLLLLVAVFLTSLLMSSTGSAATLRSFQSPISPTSPVSPVISPPEPPVRPVATPTPQPPAPAVPPSAASTLVLWILIGLVVVGTFVGGMVFFQKRRG